MVNVGSAVTQRERQVFARLCELEPKLRDLYRDARKLKDTGGTSYCANNIWYGYGQFRGKGLKKRLCNLVGFDAGYPEPTPNVLSIPNSKEPVIKTLHDLFREHHDDAGLQRQVHPELATGEAYDVAYKIIYRQLSDCRNCGCA